MGAQHRKIMEYLDELDVPYIASTKLAYHTIPAKSDDHIIGIRADIDALPMDDLVDCEYKSKVSGCAHTCGHDTYRNVTRNSKILSKIKDELTVTVRLLFPASRGIYRRQWSSLHEK